MTTPKPPLTAAEHIARAKETLTTDADPKYAIAHALVAIAELLRPVGPQNVNLRLAQVTVHDCECDDPSICAWPGHRR